MRFVLPFLLIASAAFAQEDIDPAAAFPADAITEVTQPASPDVPGTPPTPKSAPVPESPKAPEKPIGPVSEVWPANTVPLFVLACSQGNAQLFQPCRCVIDSLMKSMTHPEFMELSAKNAVDKDLRYTAARQQCALKTQAQQKKP